MEEGKVWVTKNMINKIYLFKSSTLLGEVVCEKMFVFTRNRNDFYYMIYTFLKKGLLGR